MAEGQDGPTEIAAVNTQDISNGSWPKASAKFGQKRKKTEDLLTGKGKKPTAADLIKPAPKHVMTPKVALGNLQKSGGFKVYGKKKAY